MDGVGTLVCRGAGKSVLTLSMDSAPGVAISFTCTVGFTDPVMAVTLTKTGGGGPRRSTHDAPIG